MESDGYELSHVCFEGVEPPPHVPVGRLRTSGRRRKESGSSGLASRLARTGDQTHGRNFVDPFLVGLFQAAGLDAGAYRAQALEHRLPACLRALRVASPEAARALLERKPELLPQALSAVLIGVSGFFRDPGVFEFLHRSVLPALVQGRRGLRVYSAGCSAGQELYSLALLLAELGALPASWLLGVDCRAEAIAHAAAGWFAAMELEPVKPDWRERYFQLAGARARIVPALRARMEWRVENLLTATPPAADWDVVLFRNVAIYLRLDQSGLWERLTGQLRPGGVLVTGKADRPPTGLPLRRLAPCIYQKTGK